MASAITITKLISNLRKVKNNPVTKDGVGKLFFEVLNEMALRQVNDTSQSRALIIKSFAKHFGITVSQAVQKSYTYWQERYEENKNRSWNVPNNMAYVDTKEGFYAYIGIEDEGVYRQEVDMLPPSEAANEGTGRDTSHFMTNHITQTIDDYNRGEYSDYEKEVLKIIEKIILK